jgi:hypothetical protein
VKIGCGVRCTTAVSGASAARSSNATRPHLGGVEFPTVTLPQLWPAIGARTTEKAIVSVKGGDNVQVSMVRDLAHVVDREKAKIGVFITLAEPTAPMKTEAVKAGYYETEFGKYPKIQILTIKELFEAKKPAIPLVDPAAFKKAQAEPRGKQERLL